MEQLRLTPGRPVLHLVDRTPRAPHLAGVRFRRALRATAPTSVAIAALEIIHPRAGAPLLVCSDVRARVLGGRRYIGAPFGWRLATDEPDRPPSTQIVVPWSGGELADLLERFDGATGARVVLSEWSHELGARDVPVREWQVVLWAVRASLAEIDLPDGRLWALALDLSVTPDAALPAVSARYTPETDPWALA